MLESLGLSPTAEKVYRAMLAYPDEGVAELAQRLSFAEEAVRDSLSLLSTLAIVQPVQREGTRGQLRPVSPKMAMEILLARQQADLAEQQSRIEASRAAAAQLIAECSGMRPQSADGEHFDDAEQIRERLAQLAHQTQNEIMTFAPGGSHSDADLRASRGPNHELLNRGVVSRTVYLDSVRNDKPTLEHVNWLNKHGAQVRTVVSLPVRVIIFDRRLAMLPTHTVDARTGAVLVNGEGTIAALCALFESTWATATPLGDTPAAAENDLTSQQAEMLKLLGDGLTDEAIAHRFGISPRTARRIAAELMDRLDARSRFQAGVHAAQRGWLTR
ncbi:LuxR C-terminal-related transcriptional regulator [Streptomyces sp. NPDC057697]|uniref:helix-turn-helix transcriptional regulator n=1 Tax=Streptomyces sp. NPDC057697 TaxID=3346219 RepID=UPI0036A0F5BC